MLPNKRYNMLAAAKSRDLLGTWGPVQSSRCVTSAETPPTTAASTDLVVLPAAASGPPMAASASPTAAANLPRRLLPCAARFSASRLLATSRASIARAVNRSTSLHRRQSQESSCRTGEARRARHAVSAAHKRARRRPRCSEPLMQQARMNARPNARHHNERRAPTCVAPQQPLRRASRKVGACEARHHARNSTGALFPGSRAERVAPGTAAASAAHQPRPPLPRPANPLPSPSHPATAAWRGAHRHARAAGGRPRPTKTQRPRGAARKQRAPAPPAAVTPPEAPTTNRICTYTPTPPPLEAPRGPIAASQRALRRASGAPLLSLSASRARCGVAHLAPALLPPHRAGAAGGRGLGDGRALRRGGRLERVLHRGAWRPRSCPERRRCGAGAGASWHGPRGGAPDRQDRQRQLPRAAREPHGDQHAHLHTHLLQGRVAGGGGRARWWTRRRSKTLRRMSDVMAVCTHWVAPHGSTPNLAPAALERH